MPMNIENYDMLNVDEETTLDYDWKLVADKSECSGAEEWADYLPTTTIYKYWTFNIGTCAHMCRGISSMFAFGTSDYGPNGYNRCKRGVCACICETAAAPDGTCNLKTHSGYRAYKYTKGKMY